MSKTTAMANAKTITGTSTYDNSRLRISVSAPHLALVERRKYREGVFGWIAGGGHDPEGIINAE